MTELLEEENPLFGRFTEIIHLEAFDYFESGDFYPQNDINRKIANYAVFGGSPYVLSQINPSKPMKENIVQLMLRDTGILRVYIESVILKEIQKAYDIRIFQVIGNGKKRYSELNDRLSGNNNGLLDKQLKNLMNMEMIEKTFPINKPSDKKKQFYEIRDNLIRFYFTYVFGNESLIFRLGEDTYYETYIKPSLTQFISRRFEQISLQYFRRLSVTGQMTDFLDFGTYWFDNPAAHTNGEFDCVLKRSDGYDFIECKFYTKPMSEDECEKEEQQLKSIEGIVFRQIGFVCSAGFSFTSGRYDLITGEDLFSDKNR